MNEVGYNVQQVDHDYQIQSDKAYNSGHFLLYVFVNGPSTDTGLVLVLHRPKNKHQ